DNFAQEAGVDELITVHASLTIGERLRSVDLLADAYESG
ncbi:MAG: alkane 1-monooxygenase, partial [Acidimicrobiales bacterium]